MTRAEVQANMSLVPRLNRPLREDMFDNQSHRELLAEVTDSYRPWEQVVAEINATDDGKVLRITDAFRPLSQTGKAPKLDIRKVSDNYVPVESEARVPYSVLFGLGSQRLDRSREGSIGYDTVAQFNEAGYSGTVRDGSPLVKLAKEWRERMGVVDDFEYSFPYVIMNNGATFKFPGLGYDSGVSRPYGGVFDKKDLAEMGYAAVLLSHHLDLIPTEPGDYFFMRVIVGEHGQVRLLALREKEPYERRGRNFEVLTTSGETEDLIRETLEGIDPKLEFPGNIYKKQLALDVLEVVVQNNNHRKKNIPNQQLYNKIWRLAGRISGVDVAIADANDSIDRYYD